MEALRIRPATEGDWAWLVERHRQLYLAEHGWDDRFADLVQTIVDRYTEGRDPDRQGAWIAEREGHRVGCIMCSAAETGVAQLRVLLVEPKARGQGVGRALVRRCVEFARASDDYRLLRLWTTDNLQAAKRLYQSEGFRLVASEMGEGFPDPVTNLTFEKAL